MYEMPVFTDGYSDISEDETQPHWDAIHRSCNKKIERLRYSELGIARTMETIPWNIDRLYTLAKEHLPPASKRSCSIWVAIICHTITKTSEITANSGFLFIKAHAGITVKTLSHHYYIRHPLNFRFYHDQAIISDGITVGSLPQQDGFVILRAREADSKGYCWSNPIEIESGREDEGTESDSRDPSPGSCTGCDTQNIPNLENKQYGRASRKKVQMNMGAKVGAQRGPEPGPESSDSDSDSDSDSESESESDAEPETVAKSVAKPASKPASKPEPDSESDSESDQGLEAPDADGCVDDVSTLETGWTRRSASASSQSLKTKQTSLNAWLRIKSPEPEEDSNGAPHEQKASVNKKRSFTEIEQDNDNSNCRPVKRVNTYDLDESEDDDNGHISARSTEQGDDTNEVSTNSQIQAFIAQKRAEGYETEEIPGLLMTHVPPVIYRNSIEYPKRLRKQIFGALDYTDLERRIAQLPVSEEEKSLYRRYGFHYCGQCRKRIWLQPWTRFFWWEPLCTRHSRDLVRKRAGLAEDDPDDLDPRAYKLVKEIHHLWSLKHLRQEALGKRIKMDHDTYCEQDHFPRNAHEIEEDCNGFVPHNLHDRPILAPDGTVIQAAGRVPLDFWPLEESEEEDNDTDVTEEDHAEQGTDGNEQGIEEEEEDEEEDENDADEDEVDGDGGVEDDDVEENEEVEESDYPEEADGEQDVDCEQGHAEYPAEEEEFEGFDEDDDVAEDVDEAGMEVEPAQEDEFTARGEDDLLDQEEAEEEAEAEDSDSDDEELFHDASEQPILETLNPETLDAADNRASLSPFVHQTHAYSEHSESEDEAEGAMAFGNESDADQMADDNQDGDWNWSSDGSE